MSSSEQDSFNKGGMITFLTSMVVSFGVLFYVAFLSGGVDLKEIKEKAEAVEQTQAQAGGADSGPVDVSGVKDPWMSSEQMVARGKQLFQQNCAMCHGNEGKGDGPAGGALNPKPRNLVTGPWKKGGTRLGLMDVMNNGLPPSSMQSYKHLPLNDRWALVHFVRSLNQEPVKDDDAQVSAAAAKLN